MKETIAVLMTVHDRKIKTLDCLNKLALQNLPEGYTYEVWLTDDGCTDGTRESVMESFPDIHIVDGDGNLFWNRGMWKAWDAASKHKRYDYYLWLNDDTNLYDNAISELLKESKEHNDTCNIVGSCQFEDHRGVSYGGFISGRIIAPTGKAQRVDNFNGNIVLVPESVYQKIGNLDPYYSHGHGDTDYGLRAKKAGVESWIVGIFLGECDRHTKLKKCWDPDIPFGQRFNNLFQPTGYPPRESFYFERKYKGIIIAMFHIVTLFARVCFPSLWCMMGKKRI